MKRFFIVVLSMLLSAVFSYSYELTSDVDVKWTGYKTDKKVGVSGGFKDITVTSVPSENFVHFLKGIKLQIKTLSFDSKNPARDKNITSTLFGDISAQTIFAGISHVEANHNRLMVNITMNRSTQSVPMIYSIKNNTLMAKGKIDILDFKMQNAFMAFAQKCAALHENKSFSDVSIEFVLSYK